MNLRDVRLVLRPRGVTDLVDLSLRACVSLYRPTFLRLAALLYTPIVLLVGVLHWKLHSSWGWLWLLTLVLATPLQAVFIAAAGQLLFARQVALGEVLRRGRKRLPALLGTLFLWRLLPWATVIVGFVVLQRPYVFEAVVLEGAGPGRAWKRAGELVARRPGPNFLLGALVALAPFVAGLYAQILVTALLDVVLQVPSPGSWVDGDTPFLLVGTLLAQPFVVCVRLFGYIDARTRIEGWDVQLRFAALQQAAPADAPAAREAS